MATYNTNKPAVRDSFDDEDVSDDVDDEVFIRDGKNGFKMDEERGVKRPLMAPRRKVKSAAGGQYNPEICKPPHCRTFCVPCCYALLALVALFGLVTLVVIVVDMFPFPLDKIHIWSNNMAPLEKIILPCIDLKSHTLWTRSFPKLTSEAALVLNDVNKDGIPDVIVGFGTGADELGLGDEVCPSYMPGAMPCLGGVMALDGHSGNLLWQHWSHRSVLFVDCSTDITGDHINDCIVSGKGGVLSALNGPDGNVLWELKKPPNVEEVDVYAARFISDVDFDLVPDIFAAHSSIQAGETQGHLLLLSGRTSNVIVQVSTPNYESIYSPPITLVRPDGTNILLIATGSVDSSGGLYAVPLHHLISGNISQSLQLIKGGINDSPVLVDLNKDGTEDIAAISEGTITVFDGITFNQLWNATSSSMFGRLQFLNSPTPADFNDDDVPDFLFTHLVGKSYPEYYFSQTSVVDGRSGRPLLDKPITSSAFVDIPGITLSMAGRGNDFFLYWLGVCTGHEETQQRFSFLNSTPIKQRAKADLCKLRFNSTLDIRLYAFSQHTAPPGILLYSSEAHWAEERNISWNGGPVVTENIKESKWPQQVPLSSFHHKGDSVEHLRVTPHHSHHRQQFGSDDAGPNVEDFTRIQQRRPNVEWHPQESAYGNLLLQNRRYPNLGLYNNVLNEGQSDVDSGYSQEGEEGPMFPPNALGRDEREDRHKRSIFSRVLPHVGSTSVLAPSVDGSSVDIVVTTHWLPAADNVYVRLPRDEACIQERISKISPEKYDDLETLRATVEEECFLQRDMSNMRRGSEDGGSQLIVRRLALLCSCDTVSLPQEECTHPLPFSHQSWSQRASGNYYKAHDFPSRTQPVLA